MYIAYFVELQCRQETKQTSQLVCLKDKELRLITMSSVADDNCVVGGDHFNQQQSLPCIDVKVTGM